MMGLFKRPLRKVPCDTAALGTTMLAQRMPDGAAVPRGCVGVVVDQGGQGGQTRRYAEGARLAPAARESAYCFHPGPYTVDLLPYAAAPELGLQLSFAVDTPDPRVTQQRFDLYLASEAGEAVALHDFGAAIGAALQRELAQGNMDLPPCTTLDEWNAFRASLNQLCYMRFGVTVDDCVPVDLGDKVDYAGLLMARAGADAGIAAPRLDLAATDATTEATTDVATDVTTKVAATGAAAIGAAHIATAAVTAATTDAVINADAPALRRLFLELPCVMCALRMAVLPAGQALFRQQQQLLQRLDQVSLSAATMPALALAAPGVALGKMRQRERAHAAMLACAALDEAWALLARLALARDEQLGAMFDEADRIVANLEHHCAVRRVALAVEPVPELEPALDAAPALPGPEGEKP